MQHSDASKRLDDLLNQVADSSISTPWVHEPSRLGQLKPLCEAILAITGEDDITFVCHDIEEPDLNSLAGQVVAFTKDLLVRASLQWRNGDRVAVTAGAVPRRSITNVEVLSVDTQAAAERRSGEWPNRLRVSIEVKGSEVVLPLPNQAGQVPSESTNVALVSLFRDIVSKDLPSA